MARRCWSKPGQLPGRLVRRASRPCRFDYSNNYSYIDGSYGYYGQYVSYNIRRYYFRQGFERGYRDGYYGRYQYGSYRNGESMILPAILGMILAFSIH